MTTQPHGEGGSGRVEIIGDRLSFTQPNGPVWSIDLLEIRVVAEETIETFAGGDDWIIHLAFQSQWCSFPKYAAGFGEVWDRLAERFPGMELGLANSTSFASRVLWPPALCGQPLFDYRPERNPSVLRRLTRSTRVESELTLDVAAHLRQGGQRLGEVVNEVPRTDQGSVDRP